MPGCYHCRQALPRGSGVKRTVYTGASVSGFNLSSHVWLNVVLNSLLSKSRSRARSYYSQRWVCAACASKIDAQERNTLMFIVVVVFAAISFFAISLVIGAALRH
jgi:hypothetical protein